jgi:hypothetical protein
MATAGDIAAREPGRRMGMAPWIGATLLPAAARVPRQRPRRTGLVHVTTAPPQC